MRASRIFDVFQKPLVNRLLIIVRISMLWNHGKIWGEDQFQRRIIKRVLLCGIQLSNRTQSIIYSQSARAVNTYDWLCAGLLVTLHTRYLRRIAPAWVISTLRPFISLVNLTLWESVSGRRWSFMSLRSSTYRQIWKWPRGNGTGDEGEGTEREYERGKGMWRQPCDRCVI